MVWSRLAARMPAWDDLGVRVQRTFSFIDLSGFSSLTAVEGDERAVQLIGEFRALVRGICSRRGIRIAKWLGDGAMLVGVDTQPVLASVLELQRTVVASPMMIDVTCGVTAGAVILLEGDDYIGHAVNVAARLCDLAAPNQVLAAESTLDKMPPWGTVITETQVALRGLEEPLTVASIGLRPAGDDAQPDPVCGIPLTTSTAAAIRRDNVGRLVLFCADSCLETWEGRPGPAPDEQGSVRVPLIGS
jgi:class 3 adenylate cyclase/YHS domain-containing protein